jgi:ureidoacrylate peracid hydrolase
MVFSVLANSRSVCAASSASVITVPAKPEPVGIDLKSTAVIVADMQNAYVSAGGIWDRLGQDISGSRNVVENTRKIVAAARLAGMKVIYLKMRFLQERQKGSSIDSPGARKATALATMSNRPGFKGRLMLQDQWNEEIVDGLKPEKDDIVIEKRKYSGFSQTRLDETLKTLKIKHLIITGVATNICVESTLRDAFSLDYWPFLVDDGTNNLGPDYTRKATLWNVQAFFGWVISTADVLKVLSNEKKLGHVM